MEQVSSGLENELWKQLKVDFQLEAIGFPDDKIYGRIEVTPESSRRLIKTFTLIVDTKCIAELGPHIVNVSVSGFNSKNKANRVAHIEAMPLKANKHSEKKVTERLKFFFNGQSFYPNPRITFEHATRQGLSSPVVVIKWHHLGDHKARRYLFYLDDKLIQQMSADTDGELSVGIYDLKVGGEHVLEIAATMGRKETYRSDPLEFTVRQPSDDNVDVEIINVREDRMPVTLPVILRQEGDNEQSEVEPSPPTPTLPKPKKTFRCCDRAPHDTFPGVEHYFQSSSCPPLSSES